MVIYIWPQLQLHSAPAMLVITSNGPEVRWQILHAFAAINGTTGTPDPVTGVIPTGVIPTTGANGATNAAQSNMAAAIAAKLANTPYSELSLVRKKGGVRGDITLTDTVKVYASYTLEKRVGARPFAMNDNNVVDRDCRADRLQDA